MELGYGNSEGQCGVCKRPLHKDEKFYEQTLIENERLIPVKLCEDCMAELHKCPQCGLAKPYCNDCV